MPSPARRPQPPPDQHQRERALDASRCVLVRAPAGSGKTDLLTRRFLRLLVEVDEPGEIVAITFTKAAAAEMRHRILESLEQASSREGAEIEGDGFSMAALASRALTHSRDRGWNLIDLPAQLRISTIDSFCRELALQRPLLSGLGGGLEISEQPRELYRRAARRTLEAIDLQDASLRTAIEALLLWRDNSWQEVESQLVEMLEKRDRWMHDFVVAREVDWDALRARLEQPFRVHARNALSQLSRLLDQVPGARDEALELARFACAQAGGALHRELAELAEFPTDPRDDAEELEEAQQACACLAGLLLTNDGGFRKQVNKNHGFPADRKAEKSRLLNLIADLGKIPGLEAALAAVSGLPPARYTEEDWRIVRACFTLLRRAAAELQVVFAEAAAVDYIEIAQIAEDVLRGENEIPGEAALAAADSVRHLLVDEFQDTSRRQHRLLGRLMAAWAEREGRTCFVVGDPMQSIYFFRDADAELFPRVEAAGLEIPHDLPLAFDPVRLFANFRSARPLVAHLNEFFAAVFAVDDGSGVTFSQAEPSRAETNPSGIEIAGTTAPRLELHVEFVPESKLGKARGPDAVREREQVAAEREAAREKQTTEIVSVIREHGPRIEQARAHRTKYRVAVLGRTRSALVPIAAALREAAIPFRAVELEPLQQRPEVLDALALAQALVNPQDRAAWLGLLRAPWCGLSLQDLHTLVSADDPELLARPVPELLDERRLLLSSEGQAAADRILSALAFAENLRFAQPATSAGTFLELVWLRMGGGHCVDALARANLDLLWSALDKLPEGEQDWLGPALGAAFDKLMALPDPAAGNEYGVQLMTIHKSKGLEFEVVIVPELQAKTAQGNLKLLSWLERGVAEPGISDEPTEFLVAPLQSKGSERSSAKDWVDRVYRERERQEMRRLLYVAATRAREELHLCARPQYKREKDGSLSLAAPRESLLATAWPALEDEILARFNTWRSAAQPATIASLAATGRSASLSASASGRGTPLRRLPAGFRMEHETASAMTNETRIVGAGQLYERHEGGVLSRALGTAVHALFEELARLLVTMAWDEARAAMAQIGPRVVAQVRGAGVERAQAGRIATRALEIVLTASRDPVGQWILSPHPDAASEVRWASVVSGTLRTVQVDRVFRAGALPQAAGDSAWWVIDYKTAHEEIEDAAAALPVLRKIFAPQVEAYARVLRNLHGADATVRAGLYYPRMLKFDWWEV